jgi:hypothetical protein
MDLVVVAAGSNWEVVPRSIQELDLTESIGGEIGRLPGVISDDASGFGSISSAAPIRVGIVSEGIIVILAD